MECIQTVASPMFPNILNGFVKVFRFKITALCKVVRVKFLQRCCSWPVEILGPSGPTRGCCQYG